MTPAPCGSCRLSPCHRRAECPKYRKWEKIHQAEKAARAAEINAEEAFAEAATRKTERLRRAGKSWYHGRKRRNGTK